LEKQSSAAADQLRRRVEHLDAELEESAGLLETERRQAAEQMAAAAAQLEQLRQDLAHEHSRAGEAKVKAEADASELAQRLQEMEQRLSASAEELRAAQSELTARAEEAERSRETALQTEQELRKRVQELEKGDWYLKLDDGSVFGPAPFADIYDWAVQCRIGPQHQVSRDQRTWTNAADVTDLRMDWMVPLSDGTVFGPVNLLAVHQLVADRAVDAAAVMTHKTTNEQRAVASVMPPELAELRDRTRQLGAELERKTGLLETEKREATGKLAAATGQLEQARQDLANERALAAEAKAKSAEREKGFAQQRRDMEKRQNEQAEELHKARNESKAREQAAEKSKEAALRTEQNLRQRVEELERGDWYLKLDDGSAFGPAPFADIYDWAVQCRIGPQHQVSRDQRTWANAADLPDLRMDWMVPLADGTAFGPMNLLAIHQLVADRAVDATAVMTHKTTKEQRPVASVLPPELAELREHTRQLSAELEQKSGLIETEKQRAQALAERLAKLEATLGKRISQDAPPRTVASVLRAKATAEPPQPSATALPPA
jgi:hypothetical protein